MNSYPPARRVFSFGMRGSRTERNASRKRSRQRRRLGKLRSRPRLSSRSRWAARPRIVSAWNSKRSSGHSRGRGGPVRPPWPRPYRCRRNRAPAGPTLRRQLPPTSTPSAVHRDLDGPVLVDPARLAEQGARWITLFSAARACSPQAQRWPRRCGRRPWPSALSGCRAGRCSDRR